MSYILDALKKSEQERGQGNVPSVQTVHSSSLNYRSDKKARWPYILIIAVILNLLAILYFIVDRDQPATTIAEKNTQQASIITEVKPAVASKLTEKSDEPSQANFLAVSTQNNAAQPDSTESRETDRTPADNTPPKQKVTADTLSGSGRQQGKVSHTMTTADAAGEKAELIEFYDLPEVIKKQLPAIIISAHVYSTNPLQRSIVINDKFMEQGEYVIDDLVLIEITADGAIFDYQGTRFHYGVVSSWQ